MGTMIMIMKIKKLNYLQFWMIKALTSSIIKEEKVVFYMNNADDH